MDLKRLKRPLAYLAIIAAFILMVKAKQDDVTERRNKEIVSPILEWEKNGKPVDIININKSDFFSYTRLSVLRKENSIYEGYVSKAVKSILKSGQKVYYDANYDSYCGEILSVADQIDINNGLFKVRIQLKSDDRTFNAREIVFVHTKTIKNIIQLSQDALAVPESRDNNREFLVKKVVDGRVVEQRVVVGEVDKDLLQITSGLVEGDKVIIAGQTLVVAGDRVAIRKEVLK